MITPNESRQTARDEAARRIVEAYDALMARLMAAHRPEFLEIGVTMPQAKVLYLLEAAGSVHMSQLVAMLGVSLSTVSGLVDRLVDQGLASRSDDPADRRQVVVAPTPAGAALMQRFRELNSRELTRLLGTLSDGELETLAPAMESLARAAAREIDAARPVTTPPDELDRPAGRPGSTSASVTEGNHS